MTFDIEIVLREQNQAITERLHQALDPREWTDDTVASILRDMLLAIDRAKNPGASDRYVALRNFSWIVEPTAAGVVIAIEIPSGAAVAGPFDIEPRTLDLMIGRVLASDRPKTVVH